MKIKYFAFLLFLLISTYNYAQGTNTRNNRDTVAITNIKPSLTISKCANNSITIDGRLDEPVWKTSACAKNFVEIDPGDNSKPPVKTEAYFTYDDDNLYVGFINYESDMSKVSARLSDRDNMFRDDFVGVMIDTYNDKKSAIEVWSNAKGIQGDGTWTPNDENMNFDMIFQCEAKMYSDRWTVEFAIPFKSLRFPDKKVQDWNIQIIRTRFRETRAQYSWAAISRDEPQFFKQAGTLKGLKDIKKGSNLEILPYVIGTKLDTLSSPGNPSSKLTNNLPRGDFGVGLKYGLSSNLTGELVYNPDFSQVESDATQISVNSSSALFYPEKRPFFLEGANIFSANQQVVYTRLLNNPLFAAKLVGKIGGVDIGYLAVYDRKTPFIIPSKYGTDFIVADSLKSFSNILRLKKGLKGESYLGMIFTDREVQDGHNRVLGFDGKISSGVNAFSWLLLGYDTKEINSPSLYTNSTLFNKQGNTLTFDGEKFSGFGGTVSFDHNARLWSFGLGYSQAPPERRMDVGYVSNNDYRNLSMYQQLNIYPKTGIALKIFPAVNGNLRYDYNGRIKEQFLMPNIYILFKNRINLNAWFLAVNNENYYDTYLKNVIRGGISMDINSSNYVTGGFSYDRGRYIVRFADPSYVGNGFNGSLYLIVKPVNRLTIENYYDYSELSEFKGGPKLYAGYIYRNKTSFQFTKSFFLRLVTQYNSFSGELDIDPLFSYKWNPFTIFYIGSTHNVTDYGSSTDLRGRFIQTQRQFFAKFQYLFRL